VEIVGVVAELPLIGLGLWSKLVDSLVATTLTCDFLAEGGGFLLHSPLTR